ncbi:MAG: aryl-sulfate sulfotransferase [Gammaproteobacteria bacterium]|nr:aryl-sulfate sulfotransferase [Gammaproteobacteria bacterium]
MQKYIHLHGRKMERWGVIVILLILMSACQQLPTQPLLQPQLIGEPNIQVSPNEKFPLAAIVTLHSNIKTRVEIEMSYGKNRSTHMKFDEFKQTHQIPILGLRAGREHKLHITLRTPEGAEMTYHNVIQFQAPALPKGFPHIQVKSQVDRMEPGYTLFNIMPHGDNTQLGAMAVIVDHDGEVVWYTLTKHYRDVRKLDNGNILSQQGNQLYIHDMLGNQIRKHVAMGENSRKLIAEQVLTNAFHHEVFPMDNGNLITLSIESRVFENYFDDEKDINAPRKTANVAGDVVIEITPQGDMLYQWRLLDILDPYRIGYGSLVGHWDKTLRKPTKDWTHGNAVIHDPRDDSLILSLRTQDATIKIDRLTGKLIWILSPPENWNEERFGAYRLKAVNPQPYFYPYHQHSPEIMPNGNLMIYDNGSFRSSPFHKKTLPDKAFSRAVEYKINESERTAELVWEYGQDAEQSYFSGALGDADFLPNKRNVLITHGSLKDDRGKQWARIIEVTYDEPKQEVFELTVTDETDKVENGWRVYRAERIADVYPVGG